MRSRGDRLRCLPCVAHGARPAPALAALVCSPPPLAHQGARPPASLSGWPGAAGNRAAPPGGPPRHSDALDEPDGASASPGSAHRRQQERSGSPFSASGLVPSGPGSPAAGSARPGYRPALAASERQNARIWAAPITAPRIRIGRQIGGSRARGLIAACCPARIDPERAGRQDRRKGNQGSHRHE